ncbi:uncharacterized protein HD556DRAFT_1461537 [Suillus plorans]|uniref:Uncharacterized protein n=1 Tax=Suillus plorans TaxID=116603 RepID=A0A9P7A953_9AGAM|nr:uncharacterized protein HD556DRAFT_1461537 [Suillus plorans]KAG1784789.1 hypothetical protein HD556DRAFT_1461537 [Suillus plorans]
MTPCHVSGHAPQVCVWHFLITDSYYDAILELVKAQQDLTGKSPTSHQYGYSKCKVKANSRLSILVRTETLGWLDAAFYTISAPTSHLSSLRLFSLALGRSIHHVVPRLRSHRQRSTRRVWTSTAIPLNFNYIRTSDLLSSWDERRSTETSMGVISRHHIARSRRVFIIWYLQCPCPPTDITILDWVGQPSEFNSCLPAYITSYTTPPHTLPSLSERSPPCLLPFTCSRPSSVFV